MLFGSKWNEFASLFSEKFNNIRKVIGTNFCWGHTQIQPHFQKLLSNYSMSVFEAIDSKTL